MSLAPTNGVSGKNGTKKPICFIGQKKGSHESNYNKLTSLFFVRIL